jgi:ABC-type antimicrobial peptide transport system permease subunit
MAIVLRTAGDPRSAIAAVQQQIYAVDRNQPVFDVRTMDERLAAALSSQRFQLILVGCFAFIAVLLAAAGVYGVMSYLVTQRGREIGIRMALGARPEDVLRLVTTESVGLSFIATAAGLAGAWALTRYLKSILYGITPLDALSFGLAPVALWAAVLTATMGPARRASKVDPIRSLREE